jgi:hypothetical protein
LYFSRTFELGPGHVLKPSWTLGKYVNRGKRFEHQ